MTTKEEDHSHFDIIQAGNLLPNICELVELVGNATSSTSNIDSSRESALKAAQISKSFAALQKQVKQIPQGDLSVEDQVWLIEQMNEEKARRLESLRKLANAIEPVTKKHVSQPQELHHGGDAMEIDIN